MKNRKSLILSMVLVLILIASIFLTGCGAGNSEKAYPSKGIKMVVPFGAGGGSDQFARILEQEIEAATDLEITVVNIKGAKTAVGFEEFMGEAADGYTVFCATTDSLINITQGIVDANPEDIEVLVVPQLNVDMLFINSKDERYSNFDELVAYAKDTGTELTVATVGVDGSEFITLTEIEKVTGIKFKIIPYSEPGERYAALAGNHVDILFEQPGDINSFLESGEYTSVISMSEERLEAFPQVPSSVELGIDVTNGYWRSIWVKAEVPDDIKDTLRQIIINAIETDAYQKYAHEKFLDLRAGYYDKDAVADFITSEYKIYSSK